MENLKRFLCGTGYILSLSVAVFAQVDSVEASVKNIIKNGNNPGILPSIKSEFSYSVSYVIDPDGSTPPPKPEHLTDSLLLKRQMKEIRELLKSKDKSTQEAGWQKLEDLKNKYDSPGKGNILKAERVLFWKLTATLYYYISEYAMALEYYEKIENSTKLSPKGLNNLGFCYENLAIQSDTNKENDYAEKAYKKYLEALSLAKKLDDSHAKLNILENLGWFARGVSQDYEESIAYFEDLITLLKDVGNDEYRLAKVYEAISGSRMLQYQDLLKGLKKAERDKVENENQKILLKAESDMLLALKIYKEQGKSIKAVDAKVNIAGIYILQKKYTEAEKLYREVLGEGIDNKYLNNGLAEVLLHSGKYEEALVYYEKSYKQVTGRDLDESKKEDIDLSIEDLTNVIEILEAIDQCYIYILVSAGGDKGKEAQLTQEAELIKNLLAKYRKRKKSLELVQAVKNAEAEHETENARNEAAKSSAEKREADAKREVAEYKSEVLESQKNEADAKRIAAESLKEKAEAETREAEAKKKVAEAKKDAAEQKAWFYIIISFVSVGAFSVSTYLGIRFKKLFKKFKALFKESESQKKIIEEQKSKLETANKRLENILAELRNQKQLVDDRNEELASMNGKLKKLLEELDEKNEELIISNETLNQTNEELRVTMEALGEQKKFIETQKKKLEVSNEKLLEHQTILNEKHEELEVTNEELTEQKARVEGAFELLAERKQSLEIANTELNEAMKAAGAIQEITIKNYINKFENFLPKSFVYWNKKDALSGDFFHARVKDGKIIILPADATGHGFSGGLLGTYIDARFEDLLKRNGVLSPAEYMEKLREYVVEYFRNSEKEEEGTFGAEASCSVYDPETRELQFTGAVHQIFLLKKGATEVVEIKGNRSGLKKVGLESIDSSQFETIAMKLAPGDRVFFSSDGYWDQFGGKKSKKMTRKEFRSKLVNSRKKSMKEVRSYLSEEFDAWKGELDHLDDVLVVGFEVE